MPEFTVDDLIGCYERGVFPMAENRRDRRVFLVDPELRGVMPLDDFHVSKRLARTVRGDPFDIRIDTAFAEMVEACAAPRDDHPESWINEPIKDLYNELYGRGLAHSVECWLDGELVGGLYGVALAGAFFGESMFSIERDASKVALVHLVGRLVVGGFRLLDAQFMTEHLAQFGAKEISRADYKMRLERALAAPADFYLLPPQAAGAAVLQAISHRS